MRRAFLLIVLVFTGCRHDRPLASGVKFPFGEATTPRPCHVDRAPEPATIAAIVADPARYSGRSVTISGCYTVDPYHGAVLADADERQGLPMWGGCDEGLGAAPSPDSFDRICGTFVADVEWKPKEAPLKELCPELCVLHEGTVTSKRMLKSAALP